MKPSSPPPKVIEDALDPSEREVLATLVKENGLKVIRVAPLKRYGFSGAGIYEAYFTENRTGFPYIVKIHTRSDIEKEVSSVSQVRPFFDDCSSRLSPGYTTTHGAIAYRKIQCRSSRGRDKILELKELVDDQTIPASKIASCLRHLYSDTFHEAHVRGAITTSAILLKTEYRRYFRDHLARERIDRALGRQHLRRTCAVLGTPVLNPLSVYDWGFNQEVPSKLGPVHGDLHTSNVVFARRMEPHLIDFSWSLTQGHLLKDFVLMENSLRFMLFPKCIPPEDQLRVDKELLHEAGYTNLPHIQFSNPFTKKRFARLAIILKPIREAARRVAYDNFKEYLAAQFLVLYGLLAYDSYNFFPALRALGLIGQRLLGTGYLPKP